MLSKTVPSIEQIFIEQIFGAVMASRSVWGRAALERNQQRGLLRFGAGRFLESNQILSGQPRSRFF
jgi:hypothetical protein